MDIEEDIREINKFSKLEQGVIKSLRRGKKNSVTIDELQRRLEKNGLGTIPIEDIYEVIEKFTHEGSKSAIGTYTGEDVNQFYLRGFLAPGARYQARLQNKANPIYDVGNFINRFLGGVLILFGLGFFIYQNNSMSGAVISNSTPLNASFIISFSAILIGGFLLLKSFKKKN